MRPKSAQKAEIIAKIATSLDSKAEPFCVTQEAEIIVEIAISLDSKSEPFCVKWKKGRILERARENCAHLSIKPMMGARYQLFTKTEIHEKCAIPPVFPRPILNKEGSFCGDAFCGYLFQAQK